MPGTRGTNDAKPMGDDRWPCGVRHLVDRCIRGDRAAGDYLVRRHWVRCRHMAAGILGKEYASWVEDVVQDTFCAVLENLDNWKGNDLRSLKAWMSAVLRSKTYDFLRRELRRSACESARSESDICDRTSAEEQSNFEVREAIQEAWQNFTPRQQLVVEGLANGKTRCEIARDLQVSEKTVRNEIKAIGDRLGEF